MLSLFRFLVVMFAVAAAGSVVVIGSRTIAADLPGVEMMVMPGSDKAVPMPPEHLRVAIEERMAKGDVPDVIHVSDREMNRRCPFSGHLLGCVTSASCKLGLIYVRESLSRELDHMTRVHEFAHCLYNWKH